mgnify:CR=1 FL=1|jgi:hypothetical protein
MIKVVGIRFQRAGKIYYFDPLDYDLETAMHVIVETARGVEMGTVLIPPKEVDDDKVVQPLKPVIRIATDDDEKVIEKNKEKEAEAYVICKEKIAKHGLDMKLVAAEYTFFLAIPVMFGASLLKGAKFLMNATMTSQEGVILVVGMVVAFAVSLVVIKFLMGYIKKHDFKVFGWYRIILGVIVLLCGFAGFIG